MEAVHTSARGQGLVTVGRVDGVFGVLGWLKIYSYTRPRDNILTYSRWKLSDGGSWIPFKVLARRRQGAGFVASLHGISDRDSAAEWIGSEIAVDREALPENAAGEYYWADLIGLGVFNQDGLSLGEITGLLETGANDVLVVSGTRERLIPFVVPYYVQEVDLQRGCVVVHWHPDD